MNTLKTLKYPM